MNEVYDLTWEELVDNLNKSKQLDGVRGVANISTVHVRKEDVDALKKLLNDDKSPFFFLAEYDYGFFLGTFSTEELSSWKEMYPDIALSKELCDIILKLSAMSVHYLSLDCDGFIIKDLPTFNW